MVFATFPLAGFCQPRAFSNRVTFGATSTGSFTNSRTLTSASKLYVIPVAARIFPASGFLQLATAARQSGRTRCPRWVRWALSFGLMCTLEVIDRSPNMVFTLGLRHTFQLCQRGLALVQPLVFSIVRFVQGGVVKTFR